MTPRDGKASARNQNAPPLEERAHVDPPFSDIQSAVSSLERIFQNAAPEERDRLLTLAREQGLLFSHQLPQASVALNGSQSPLAQILSGRNFNRSPLRVQPFDPEDAELDAEQREAVAKALQTPDVCLIQGLPGTGKRRVAEEIIRQAAARGERVLLLAPRTGAIDVLLERVAAAATVLPVRCLNRGENHESLPPPIRLLTFAGQVSALKEQAVQQARREAMAAEARLDQLRRLEPQWTKLQELAGALSKLGEREKLLTKRMDRLADTVRQDAAEAESKGTIGTSFQKSLNEALTPLRVELAATDGACADVRRKITAMERDQQERESLLGSLRPLVEAKRHGRWWTPLWWRATLSGSRLNQFVEIESAAQLAQTTLDKRNIEARELFQEEARRRTALDLEFSRRVEGETAQRRAELEREEADLCQEKASLVVLWVEVHRQIGIDATAPEAANLETTRQAHEAWQAKVRQQEDQTTFAREWADGLGQEARNLDRYLRDGANLVAATSSALAADEHFGDSVQPPISFDILLLLEAQEVAEAEIIRFAGRAKRVVLIGEPAAVFDSEDSIPLRANPGAPRPTVAPRGSSFQTLWHLLHCDPRCLPYSWIREGEQLCCRLRSATSEQRRWVEKESVADFPEIELRILAQPRKPPVLIEVLFPSGYSIQQAKEYIVRELEELPISTNGASVRWDERPEHIVLGLAEPSLPHEETVVLEPGVLEMIGSPAEGQSGNGHSALWYTCCIEFERAAGWQRQSAEEWVQRRLGLVDLGRTKELNHPYRMQPDLALFLSHLLFDGQYRIGPVRNGEMPKALNGQASWGPPVEFVAIAADHNDEEGPSEARRSADSTQSSNRTSVLPAAPVRSTRLEVNLADAVQRGALPEQLRSWLPREGFVNVSEAQSVIQSLESLVQHAAFRAHAPREDRPAVGVVALSSAQVELIRRLIDQSPTLRKAAVDFQVADPEAFRDRECHVMLVSLTRSPGNRAGSLGERPHPLVWSLTRARDKVLLFGDAGALKRRCQSDRPVGSLEEPFSRWEREILARLVEYLNGAGAFPRVFHLRQGGWT